jgi:hypothetical protein
MLPLSFPARLILVPNDKRAAAAREPSQRGTLLPSMQNSTYRLSMTKNSISWNARFGRQSRCRRNEKLPDDRPPSVISGEAKGYDDCARSRTIRGRIGRLNNRFPCPGLGEQLEAGFGARSKRAEPSTRPNPRSSLKKLHEPNGKGKPPPGAIGARCGATGSRKAGVERHITARMCGLGLGLCLTMAVHNNPLRTCRFRVNMYRLWKAGH